MNTYFICSDIHSFYDEWMASIKDKGFDINNPSHKLIVCGDLFDRGNQTVECYEFANDMISRGRMTYVRGNHEYLLQQMMREIKRGEDIRYHHVSNGTLHSFAQFMGVTEYDIICGTYTNSKFDATMNKVNEFIDTRCVNYFELGDFVFVHSWLPLTNDKTGVDPNWRSDYADWYGATWGCPFDQWYMGAYLEDKTVVCGHWHTSYAHAKYNKDGSEWGKDANFGIFMRSGIIGLDACTAHTHKVNCLVIEENENGTYNIRQENSN